MSYLLINRYMVVPEQFGSSYDTVDTQSSILNSETNKPEWADLTGEQIIGRYKKGSIRRRFPKQFLDKTFAEIEKAAKAGQEKARTAMKLLKDNRFNKDAKE